MSKRSSRWGYIRKLAWERDKKANAVCHLCQQPIDYTLPPGEYPDSWSPDHIYTFHDRPDLELDLSNVAPSHRRCNYARGTKDASEQAIGRHSRIW